MYTALVETFYKSIWIPQNSPPRPQPTNGTYRDLDQCQGDITFDRKVQLLVFISNSEKQICFHLTHRLNAFRIIDAGAKH